MVDNMMYIIYYINAEWFLYTLYDLCALISIGLLRACDVKLQTFDVERVSGTHIPHVAQEKY